MLFKAISTIFQLYRGMQKNENKKQQYKHKEEKKLGQDKKQRDKNNHYSHKI